MYCQSYLKAQRTCPKGSLVELRFIRIYPWATLLATLRKRIVPRFSSIDSLAKRRGARLRSSRGLQISLQFMLECETLRLAQACLIEVSTAVYKKTAHYQMGQAPENNDVLTRSASPLCHPLHASLARIDLHSRQSWWRRCVQGTAALPPSPPATFDRQQAHTMSPGKYESFSSCSEARRNQRGDA